MKKVKITLTNDFHNTSVNVMVPRVVNGYGQIMLSKSQSRRVDRETCGMDSCCCPGITTIEIDGEERKDLQLSSTPMVDGYQFCTTIEPRWDSDRPVFD